MLREAHQAQLLRLEDQQEAHAAASAVAARQQQAIAAAEQDRIEAEAGRQAALASMTPNLRRIAEFKASFAARAEQLRGGRERQNGDYYARARKLALESREGADWSAEEKSAAADAIAEWLPKVVEKIDKDQLKKLKLADLRTS